jgi:hypothetical protein
MFARASLELVVEEASLRRLEALRVLRDEVKGLVEQQAVVQRRRSLASTATQVRPDELQKSVTVQVTTSGAVSQARLVLEYFVTGARWAPAYQCRMSRDCRAADLQLRALVIQRTGEDWAQVSLKLSTAAPMSFTELPELAAIRIGRSQPSPSGQRRPRPPPQGAASLFTDYDRSFALAREAQPVIPTWQPRGLQLTAAPEALEDDSDDEASGMEADGGEFEALAPAEDMVEREEAPKRAEAKKMVSRRMPPAPPMAAPAPMAVGRSMLAAKGGGSRGAGPMMDLAEDEGGGGGPGGAFEVLRFASLRLGGPADRTRGQLTATDRRQAFLDSLTALGLTVAFDVMAVVERAEASGQEIQHITPPSGWADVRAEAGWYDYVYSADAAVDVPSDGGFHSVPVNTRSAASDVLYVVVPREDPQVYRQALVRNPLPSPLLPGPVEVSVGGEYVLTTTLPSVAPGGDFKLSLGVEQAVKVARNTRYVEQRSGDKVVATNELIHDVTIELVNSLDREAKFEVRERLPQPAPDAEVVVEEGKVSPAWEKYAQDERGQVIEGGRRWVLSVKGGATQHFSAQYRVKLYANNELVGGNRREA